MCLHKKAVRSAVLIIYSFHYSLYLDSCHKVR